MTRTAGVQPIQRSNHQAATLSTSAMCTEPQSRPALPFGCYRCSPASRPGHPRSINVGVQTAAVDLMAMDVGRKKLQTSVHRLRPEVSHG